MVASWVTCCSEGQYPEAAGDGCDPISHPTTENRKDGVESIKYEKLKYGEALVRLRLSELQRYQSQLVREKRDRRILNRGQEDPVCLEKGICTPAQVLIIPELGRIAATVSSVGELSFDEKLLFVKDLRIQCVRDYDVVYIPNEAPIQGQCPAATCRVKR